MPFYKRLTEEDHSRGIRVVGVSAQEVNAYPDFVVQSGLYVDFVGSSTVNKIKVRGTPILVEVDSKGVVVSSWERAVNPEKERDVEGALIPGS